MNKAVRFAAVAALVLLTLQVVPSLAATSTTPSVAAQVVLTIIPPRLPADGGVYPAAVVSLEDSNNLPTAALSNITIFLTSDQTNIVSVPSSVVISAGQDYAIANVTTTATPGQAMITASSEGLGSPQPVQVSTVAPSGYPSKLEVFASPGIFLPRADSGVVRVEVVDQSGLPSKAISDIPISLTSSNDSIASLGQTSLTIPAGSIFADGSFITSNPGTAVISATSTGYSTGAGVVTVNHLSACTSSCGASKLALRVIAAGTPGTLPSDGGTYKVLEVSLETSSGTPATSSSDAVVQLTSDKSELASVPPLVSISAGSISTLATVTTSALAGIANLTATAAGLLPATVSVQTVIPAPSKLQVYVAPPSTAYSKNGNYPILVVQLQDSSGNPARARQDTSVIVTSSNSSLVTSFVTLGISKGNDYVFSYLHTKGVGKSVLTASSPDLASSQSPLVSAPNPLVVSLQLSSPSGSFIYENQTASFTFSAQLVGQPLQNLNVSWAASGGQLSPTFGTTGTSGTSSVVFTPGTYGAYNISAGVTSPQTGVVYLVYHLIVAQVPPKPSPSLAEQIIGFWYYLVAAAAVVVVAVVYLLRMRRKKQRAEIEAGFEVV
jgi:hypothetical protein